MVTTYMTIIEIGLIDFLVLDLERAIRRKEVRKIVAMNIFKNRQKNCEGVYHGNHGLKVENKVDFVDFARKVSGVWCTLC